MSEPGTDNSEAAQSETADFVVFVAADGLAGAPPGTERDYSKLGDFFTRRKEDVAAELDRMVNQMQDLVRGLAVKMENYELHQVTFELGFSAEGHLGFIAKAGANGSVQVTFQRKHG